jgi:4-methyl-5(b-hydroxyethyl)-thiazole monophosphate biosynthesis
MTRAIIAVANGCEEIETLATYDLLTRAGIVTTLAAVDESDVVVTAAHKLKFIANCTLSQKVTEDFDVIVLPGGLPGAEHLRDCNILIEMLRRQKKSGKWIAAICAAPGYVLGTHNLTGEAKVTGYPGTEGCFKTATYVDQKVCVDSNEHLITAQGPAYTNAFALAIIANLCGTEIMRKVADAALITA